MTLEEYELYELTKPSFIQNVNFSTEAKHRDPIEPLVQGRRIGGIVRGGDTPEPQTQRKIYANFPPYLFGYIEDNKVFLAENESNSLVVNPEQGIITGSGPLVKNIKSFIVEKLSNAGVEVTDAEGYKTTLNVGDAIPEWSEYERVISQKSNGTQRN